MNTYAYDEITVGQEEQFQAVITPEHMHMFREITGDCNPLHCDDDFAIDKGYPGKVAYGMLTASFLSTLAGVYLPGRNCLIHEVEVKFIKSITFDSPEITGDNGYCVNLTGIVTEKHDLFRRLTIKVRARNDAGEEVMRSIMKVGVSE